MCLLYMYNVISGSINPSLPILITFISFPWLISVARIFDTKSNRNCKSGHPCLVSELREKTFSFSQLSIMLAVHLSRMAFIMLIYVLFISFLIRRYEFLSWMDVEFCQMLFLHLLKLSGDIYPSFCQCGMLH